MKNILRDLREWWNEDRRLTIITTGFVIFIIGIVAIFLSGFFAGNYGTTAGIFSFALGTILIVKFRGIKDDPVARGLVLAGVLLAVVGVATEFIIGARDCNILTKLGVFLAVVGIALALLVGAWEWFEEKLLKWKNKAAYPS